MLYNFKIMQLYLIFACSICFTFVIGDEYLLDFPLGRVLGKTRTTITGVTLYSFQGVPFAEPPVNELRFQAPIPKEPWDGIINGTEERSYCLQMTTDNVDGDEDCLFINIFSPKDPKLNSKLPVMVYMYGGGFIEGASSDVNIGPDHLMDYDVVYVTLNYRVGPFGFFSTGDNVIPGNAGLKDQVLAMKFVNKYIQYFGGDPDKVTIFGQSAGGASVHYHVLSPQSKGLFRAAICESGSSISAWASQRNQTEISFRLVEIINPDFVNRKPSSSEVYEYLKTLPATTIDRAAHVIHKMESPSDNQIQQGFFFAPVIEHDHEDAFLTQSMYKMLQNGEFNDVKVIIGVNSEESLFYVTDEKFPNVTIAVDSDNTILVPRSLNAKESDHAAIAQKIKDFYSPYLNFTGNWRSLIKYFSDQSFARSLIKSAELQSRWADVYFYEFQYHGVLGGFTNDPVIGFSDDCRHGEETSYILRRNYGGLNTTDLSKYPEIDQTVQKRIIRMWTDFAKYLLMDNIFEFKVNFILPPDIGLIEQLKNSEISGEMADLATRNPTPEPIDLLQNITWPTVKPNDFQYLAIGAWLEVRKNPKEDMYRFWEQIFSSYGTEPFTSY